MHPTMPTLPTWAWMPRERVSGRSAPAQPRPRTRDPKYAIYDVRKHTRHLIRLDRLGRTLLLSRPRGSAAPAAALWDFDDTPLWKQYDFKMLQTMGSYAPVTEAAAGGPAAGGGEARGWAVAAVVVAVLLLIVRSTETCFMALLKTHFHKILPTACFIRGEDPRSPHYPFGNVAGFSGSVPPPPPYEECACADEPPPYESCSAPYNNINHELPLIHAHTRQRQNILDQYAELTTDFDNVQNDLIESRIGTTAVIPPGNTDNLDSGVQTELLFAEVVVERVPTDTVQNSNDTARNDGEEPTKDIIMYIDETAANNATANRVILV